MGMIHGGWLVAKALKKEGVEVVFTLSGGHIAAIYDGCVREGIRVVDTRHEQAAVQPPAESFLRGDGSLGKLEGGGAAGAGDLFLSRDTGRIDRVVRHAHRNIRRGDPTRQGWGGSAAPFFLVCLPLAGAGF